MDAVILSAGKGTRMKLNDTIKPLVKLNGKPLIQHTIENLYKAGCRRFIVITGHKRSLLETFCSQLSYDIVCIYNKDYEKANALSLARAEHIVKIPFILSMCDHVFDHEIVKKLLKSDYSECDAVLAVDHNVGNPHVDLFDVTRVYLNKEGTVTEIGKNLHIFNGFDTGLFLCSKRVFRAIEWTTREKSISNAMKYIYVKECNVTGKLWIDVDTPEMLKLAEGVVK